jgi:hypothetical protein
MELIKKKTYVAFSKNVYLIGINDCGEKVFLEEPSWNCGRYWGFGYLEVYTNNNNPSKTKDIRSHTHFTDFDDNTSLCDWHILTSCVLSHSELLTLKSLMKEALSLGEEARKTTSKEYKNLRELHKSIIDMLKP